MHEAGGPEMVVDLLDADRLAGEDLAEVDLLAVEQMRPQVVAVWSHHFNAVDCRCGPAANLELQCGLLVEGS